MEPESDAGGSSPSKTVWVPIAIVLGIIILACFAVFTGVDIMTSGTREWFYAGGPFMRIIAIVAILQFAFGVGLSMASLRHALPIWVHLVAPFSTAFLGLVGSQISLLENFERTAVLGRTPDLAARFCALNIAYSNYPREFGYLVGGIGAITVACAVMACSRFVSGNGQPENILSRRMLSAVCCTMGVWCVCTAFLGHMTSEILLVFSESIQTFPFARVSEGLGVHRTITIVLRTLMFALVVTSSLFFVFARRGSPSIASRTGLKTSVTILPLLALVASDHLHLVRADALMESQRNKIEPPLLNEVSLPQTTSDEISEYQGRLVVLASGRLAAADQDWVNLDSVTPKGLTRWLKNSSLGTGKQANPGTQGDENQRSLLSEMERLKDKLSLSRDIRCGDDSLPTFFLAFDASTTMAEANLLAAGLREAGGCKTHLLGRPKQDSLTLLRELENSAPKPLQEFFKLLAASRQRTVRVYLSGDSAIEIPIAIHLSRDRVQLAVNEKAWPIGERLTLETLQPILIRLKGALPEIRDFTVSAQDDVSIANFIELLDRARDVTPPNGEMRFLFDRVHWVAAPKWTISGARSHVGDIDTGERHSDGGLNHGSKIKKARRDNDRGANLIRADVESIPKEAIKKVINQNRNQIRFCYEFELQKNPRLTGKIRMKWVIDATGRVVKSKVMQDTIQTKRVGKCLRKKIMRWKFPAPTGGGIVEVNYPFVFESD